jgi:hypothetical protein
MPINPSLEDCTNGFVIPAAVKGGQSAEWIMIFDERRRGDNSKPRLERVVATKPDDRRLGAQRSHVQEQGQALPSAASVRFDRMIGNPRFSQGFDEHARLLKRENIALEGAMLAMEGHG